MPSLIALFLLAAVASHADEAAAILLVPTGATQARPGGASYPVAREAPDTPLTRAIRTALAEGQMRESLRLDRWARNLRLSDLAGADTDEARGLREPAYLLLSSEEGGFARHGFWLEQADGERRFHTAAYVDVVVEPSDIDDGEFQRLVPHELGHVILRTLVGAVPPGYSRAMHMSTGLTDYPTAFDEGWAEHFEPLSRDASPRRAESGDALKALWLSASDTLLRDQGVRRNLFVWRKAEPPATLDAEPDPYRLWLESQTLPAYREGTLETGQAMMASEGLIASVFYRLVTDARIQQRYRERAFYQTALGRRLDGEPQAVVTPRENASLKLMAALRGVGRTPLQSGRPWMIALVGAYSALFPDEREAVVDVFVRTTCGATVSRDLAGRAEALAKAGSHGDIASFGPGLGEARGALLKLVADVLARRADLDAAIGPEIWVVHPDLKVGTAPWSPDRSEPLTLNLNTARVADLMALPGVTRGVALKIVEARDRRGYFADVTDLRGVAGVPEAVVSALVRMHEAMAGVAPFQRE